MDWRLSRTSRRNSDIETPLTGFFTDVMVQHYNPGQRMQIDFSGSKLYWADMGTGKQRAALPIIIDYRIPYFNMRFYRN